MYDWEYELIEYVRRLALRKKELQDKLDSFPAGYLVTTTRKKTQKKEYYHRISIKGKITQKYISPETGKNLISSLSEKRLQTPAINAELAHVENVYQYLLPMCNNILSKITITKERYLPFYSENPKKPEHLKYRTLRGELVRSISEKTIADALFRYNLDYKYEKALQLGSVTIYPDFTIINPINGKTYYWEFLGLNTEEYLKSWDFKVSRFAENNISRENYLIVSTMDEINAVDNIIKNTFTLQRYNDIYIRKRPTT